MKRVMFRVLGGKEIGYGHYYRCLSLAKAIKLLEKDVIFIFLINQELVNLVEKIGFEFIVSNELSEDYKSISKLNINLFIFDSYLGDNEYLRKVKEKSRLMLIDDNNDIYDSLIPDIIYNGNIHAEKLRYPDVEGQLKLLGPEYLIMKEEYWDNHINYALNKDGILITTGGTDEYSITFKILETIKDLDIKIKVVIGPGYREEYIRKIENLVTENIELVYKPDSLKNLIATSKVVITACGSTIYEVLSQKSIPIIFSIASNQDLIINELSKMRVEYLGKYPNIDYSRLPILIQKLQYNSVDFKNNIFNLVKGNGALVVAGRIIKEI